MKAYFFPLFIIIVVLLLVLIPELPDFFQQKLYTDLIYFSVAMLVISVVVVMIMGRGK